MSPYRMAPPELVEMQKQLKRRLPKGVECVFISAVSGQGIAELKDLIFTKLNADA